MRSSLVKWTRSTLAYIFMILFVFFSSPCYLFMTSLFVLKRYSVCFDALAERRASLRHGTWCPIEGDDPSVFFLCFRFSLLLSFFCLPLFFERSLPLVDSVHALLPSLRFLLGFLFAPAFSAAPPRQSDGFFRPRAPQSRRFRHLHEALQSAACIISAASLPSAFSMLFLIRLLRINPLVLFRDG